MLKYKLVFFYGVFCIVLVVASLFLLTKLDKTVEIYEKEKEKEEKITEIKSYETELPLKTIKVKITNSGAVEEMDINDYLIGVVPSEMPPSSEIEALKAQAIVARTYAYEKMSRSPHTDCDICDNASHCQAYYDISKIEQIWENRGFDENLRKEYLRKVKEAVYSTENVVAVYNGELIKAYFHADSGGKTEDVSAIWGKQHIPYLVSVESKGEEAHQFYKSSVSLTVSELEQKLNSGTSKQCSINSMKDDLIKIISYTSTGRVDQVDIAGNIYTASELRSALGLKSTNFTVEYVDKNVVFNVTGYGHGVGMSQTGANYYAKEGWTAEDIIKHYYTGVDIAYLKTNEED